MEIEIQVLPIESLDDGEDSTHTASTDTGDDSTPVVSKAAAQGPQLDANQLALAERLEEHMKEHEEEDERENIRRLNPNKRKRIGDDSSTYTPLVSSQHWAQSAWCGVLSAKSVLGCNHSQAETMTVQHLISLLKLRDDATARGILRKLNAGQTPSQLERAYIERNSRDKYTHYRINPIVGMSWTGDAIRDLKKVFSTAPHFLARSVTLSGASHTNGHATETHFSPSCALDGRKCRGSIFDIPFVQLAPMLGDHLAWSNRIQDELLSWTNSWLFAIVHLYLRHLKGQGDAYLFCVDRRKATKVRNESEARERVDFFYALPLCNATGLARYPWSNAIKGKLTYRKFTHEYLTHGIVEYSEDSELRPVSWEGLIQGGIFTLIPEMRVPEGMVASGLYYVLLFLRKTNYDSIKLTSRLELDTAETLARLHVRGLPTQSHSFGTKPPLVIFVYYLTLRKRGMEDALFQERVTRLGYTRHDLDDVLYRGYEKLPDNLPEQASFLNLLRNVQAVVGGSALEPDTLIGGDSVSGQRFASVEESSKKYIKLFSDPAEARAAAKAGKKSKTYSEKGRCRYSCNCIVWKSSKSKGKAVTKEDGQEDGADGTDAESDDEREDSEVGENEDSEDEDNEEEQGENDQGEKGTLTGFGTVMVSPH